MYRLFGLSRDPFAAACDGGLFWESPSRARARAQASAALAEGTSVWIRGEEGSGRATFLTRLAGDLALEGRRVLLRGEADPTAPLLLVDGLLAACGESCAEGDFLDRAGNLYGRLLDAFRRTGPTIVVPAVEALAPEELGEARILSELRVAGQPLAPVALTGPGSAPFPGLREFVLSRPDAGEVRAFLAHRAAVCQCPDLLPAEELERISAAARGLGHSLELARAALARLAFRLPDTPREDRPTSEGGTGVLDPAQLQEADSLMTALCTGPGVPESF